MVTKKVKNESNTAVLSSWYQLFNLSTWKTSLCLLSSVADDSTHVTESNYYCSLSSLFSSVIFKIFLLIIDILHINLNFSKCRFLLLTLLWYSRCIPIITFFFFNSGHLPMNMASKTITLPFLKVTFIMNSIGITGYK